MAQTAAATAAAASIGATEDYTNSTSLSEHLILDVSKSQQQQAALQLPPLPAQEQHPELQMQPMLQEEAAFRDDGRIHQSYHQRASNRLASNYTEPKYYLGKLQTNCAKPAPDA